MALGLQQNQKVPVKRGRKRWVTVDERIIYNKLAMRKVWYNIL